MEQGRQTMQHLDDGAQGHAELFADGAQRQAIAYFEPGKLYLGLIQSQEAVNDLLKVVELRPDPAQSHYLLGRAYQSWGLKDQANQEYQRFAELKENSPGSHKKAKD